MKRFNGTQRSGITTVESAIILTTLLVLVIGILDMGIATYRYNLLAEAARRLAREAIVRGNDSIPETARWGPEQITGTANDNFAAAASVRSLLAGFDLSEVKINITWPDDGHKSDDRVRVELRYHHDPIALLQLSEIDLCAVSTMRIVH